MGERMSGLNRRNFLRVGGAAGALSAVQLAVPSRVWAWSSTGSLAGAGPNADPTTVYDVLADPVIARLYERNQWEQVNQALTGWTTNDQPTPTGLPSDATEFIDRARQLPAWTDTDLLDEFNDFYQQNGSYIGLLYGIGSGFMSTAIPNESRAVYYSQGGAQMKDRIAKTALLGYDSVQPDAYTPSGAMIVTAVKTRMIHSAVRHLLPQSRYYPTDKIPISQADILITWHSLATFAMQKLTDWKVPVTEPQANGFLHLWQVTAHMLGVQDRYIPATWDDAYEQNAALLQPVLGPTPEGVNLAEILIELVCKELANLPKPFICAFIHYVLGDTIAGYAQIPNYPEIVKGITEAWPWYVKAQSAGAGSNLVPAQFTELFDEIVEQGVLDYFSDGTKVDITLPSGNRTNFTNQSGNQPWSAP
jgi:endo-cleaving rubber dioxygenase